MFVDNYKENQASTVNLGDSFANTYTLFHFFKDKKPRSNDEKRKYLSRTLQSLLIIPETQELLNEETNKLDTTLWNANPHQRIIESIDELPSLDELSDFNQEQLNDFSKFLEMNYFPKPDYLETERDLGVGDSLQKVMAISGQFWGLPFYLGGFSVVYASLFDKTIAQSTQSVAVLGFTFAFMVLNACAQYLKLSDIDYKRSLYQDKFADKKYFNEPLTKPKFL